MKHIFLILLVGFISINFSVAQSKKLGDQKNLKLVNVQKVELTEDKYTFTKATDLAVSDNYFFISCKRPPIVIKYNFSGEQIKKIGSIGRGPFEYISPSKIEIENNKLFIWDSDLLKLTTYSTKGNEIDEIAAFSEAIEDFKIIKDKIALFLSGKKSEHYVKVLNYKNNTMLAYYGNRNEVHDLLMMYTNSGGVAFLDDSHLLYGSPAADIIYLSDINAGEVTAINLNEDRFKVEVNDVPKYRPATIDKVAKYLFSNSRLSGLYVLKNYIVVELQVGKVEDKSRTNILHVFNKSFNKLDTITLNFEFLESNGEVISATNGNTLYYLNNYSSEVDPTKAGRILTGWKISKIQ